MRRSFAPLAYALMRQTPTASTSALRSSAVMASRSAADGVSILDGFMRILEDGYYAPMESLKKSLLGRKGARAVIRSEKRGKKPKAVVAEPKAKKPLASAARVSVQPSMF